MSDQIKCISLWQPWASLWLSPSKWHETRHWATPHRGELLVHATKHMEFDVSDTLADILCSEFGGHWGMDLPRGAIIGTVELTSVLPCASIYPPDRGPPDCDDFYCGDFSEGRYGWRRGGYRVFPKPIPYKGRQSMFGVPRELVAEQIAKSELRY